MANKMHWKILDRGTVPETGTNTCLYACMGCGNETELEVVGTALAQINAGLVFDVGPHATPVKIQCRKCRRVFELEAR